MYSPSLLVEVLIDRPFSCFDSDTIAPVITAPAGSKINPLMDPPAATRSIVRLFANARTATVETDRSDGVAATAPETVSVAPKAPAAIRDARRPSLNNVKGLALAD